MRVLILPTVQPPATLFWKVYMDTMSMPKTGGFKGIIQAWCSLSAYPEARRVREETGDMIATFIFEDLLCRWGALEEIVTDNGLPFVKALNILGKKYKIFNIRILVYNSHANGIVKRQHRPIHKLIVKAADGVESKWPLILHSVMWAEHIIIQKSTGYSPYWIAHGTKLLFPFDLAEATYLAPPLDMMETMDLLMIWAWQLQKWKEDLEMVKERVLEACYVSVRHFLNKHQHTIRDFDFKPGALVLVRNSVIKMELNRKSKPRYLGLMVVVRRTERGAYVLTELDGTIVKTSYAAFWMVPYHARRQITGPIPEEGDYDIDDALDLGCDDLTGELAVDGKPDDPVNKEVDPVREWNGDEDEWCTLW
jgi:hypothetical protein